MSQATYNNTNQDNHNTHTTQTSTAEGENDINYISSFELYPKEKTILINKEKNIKNISSLKLTTKKAPTRKKYFKDFFNDDILRIIYEYAEDHEPIKNFISNYDLYFKLYKNIRSSFNINDNIKILNEFEQENKNFIVIVNKKNYYVDLMTPEQTEEEAKEYIKDNIIYLYNDINYYDRILLDKHYIKNDFRLGIKKSIIKKIKKAIEQENHILIYNLLDLETFHNNSRFNICDLLNLYDIINNIRIIENGEREGTRRATRYNILIREN